MYSVHNKIRKQSFITLQPFLQKRGSTPGLVTAHRGGLHNMASDAKLCGRYVCFLPQQ